jgi:hypothetical protein
VFSYAARTLIFISALPAESQRARLFRATRPDIGDAFVFFFFLFCHFAWAKRLTFVK